jgi:integrase
MSVQKIVRANTTRYLVLWRDGGRDSRMRSKTFSRRTEADAFDQDVKRRKRTGAGVPTLSGRERLGDLTEEWWAAEAPSWAKSTQTMRSRVLRRWVEPYLAEARVRDINHKRLIKRYRTQIVADGCSHDQANKALSILSAFFGWLADSEMIEQNPCSRLKKLPVMVKRPRALTPYEVEQLRAVMTPRDAPLVSLMAYAGLRPAEAFALSRDSVREWTIIVDRSFTAGQLKLTKNHLRRSVHIVQALADDLAAWESENELLCADVAGRCIDLSNWRNRVWNPAVKASGVKATPYDLRHTFCSLLAHEGRSMPYIASQMGHGQLETQRHYAHMIEDARLSPGKPMAEAIAEARVHFVCNGEPDLAKGDLAEVIDLQQYREAGAAGIEPATLSLEGSCSIH